jgi:hypothetical protein
MNHPAPGQGFTPDEPGRLPDVAAPGGTEMPPPATAPPAQARAWPPPPRPAGRTHDPYGWLDDGLPRTDRFDQALDAALTCAVALHAHPHQREPLYTGAQAELIAVMFGMDPAVKAERIAGVIAARR